MRERGRNRRASFFHARLREYVCLCVRVRGPANPNEGFRRQLEIYENSLKANGFSSNPPHFDTYIIHQASNTLIYAHTCTHAHARGRTERDRKREKKRSGQMCACLHVCVPVLVTRVCLHSISLMRARPPTQPHSHAHITPHLHSHPHSLSNSHYTHSHARE